MTAAALWATSWTLALRNSRDADDRRRLRVEEITPKRAWVEVQMAQYRLSGLDAEADAVAEALAALDEELAKDEVQP